MFGAAATYCDMLFVDHGIFRLAYPNRHRLGERAWRSAQPAPRDIRALAELGIRTIVNLRGKRQCGSYTLERAACERYGIVLVDFHMRSHRAPPRDHLKAALDLFERIEYPMLMHCKSGADRTGLMSVLYCLVKLGEPLSQAMRQLSPRYGHFRLNNAGILDTFFESYLEDDQHRSMPLVEWIDKYYDPEALTRSFRTKGWIDRIVDQVLNRV